MTSVSLACVSPLHTRPPVKRSIVEGEVENNFRAQNTHQLLVEGNSRNRLSAKSRWLEPRCGLKSAAADDRPRNLQSHRGHGPEHTRVCTCPLPWSQVSTQNLDPLLSRTGSLSVFPTPKTLHLSPVRLHRPSHSALTLQHLPWLLLPSQNCPTQVTKGPHCPIQESFLFGLISLDSYFGR